MQIIISEKLQSRLDLLRFFSGQLASLDSLQRGSMKVSSLVQSTKSMYLSIQEGFARFDLAGRVLHIDLD